MSSRNPLKLNTQVKSKRQRRIYHAAAAAAAAAKSLHSCPILCDPRDSSPPGSPIPGILQARTLEWVAISSSNAWKWKVKVKSLSHVRALCDPMDCSLLGSSAHGIFQARVLEWVATAFSKQGPTTLQFNKVWDRWGSFRRKFWSGQRLAYEF